MLPVTWPNFVEAGDIPVINYCILQANSSGPQRTSDLLDELQTCGIVEKYPETVLKDIIIQSSNSDTQSILNEKAANFNVNALAHIGDILWDKKYISENNYIRVRDNNSNKMFTVNTGCGACLIPEIPEERRPPQSQIPSMTPTVEVLRLYDLQYIKMNFDFLGNVRWPFTIADVPHPIIGLDFMAHFNLALDCKCRKVFRLPISPASLPSEYDTCTEINIYDSLTGLTFTIDTGTPRSTISILSINESLRPLPLSRLYSGSKTPILEYEYRRCEVSLGLSGQYSWKFSITSSRKNYIGTDFLSHFHLIVDARGKRLLNSDTLTIHGN